MVYIIGLLGGFASGFFGAGGGFIILPAIVNLLHVDEYKARGTTLASILVAILVAAAFYSKYNYFDMSTAIYIAIGGIAGGFIGAKWLKKIPKDMLEIVFDIFLIYISIKMIMQG